MIRVSGHLTQSRRSPAAPHLLLLARGGGEGGRSYGSYLTSRILQVRRAVIKGSGGRGRARPPSGKNSCVERSTYYEDARRSAVSSSHLLRVPLGDAARWRGTTCTTLFGLRHGYRQIESDRTDRHATPSPGPTRRIGFSQDMHRATIARESVTPARDLPRFLEHAANQPGRDHEVRLLGAW